MWVGNLLLEWFVAFGGRGEGPMVVHLSTSAPRKAAKNEPSWTHDVAARHTGNLAFSGQLRLVTKTCEVSLKI